jgi:hypothetical protein
MRWLLLATMTTGFGLFAQETEQRTISVQLSRDVWVTPDVAVVTVTVSTFFPISVAEAAGFLKPAGFAESDVSDARATGPNELPELPGNFAIIGPPPASYAFFRKLPAGQLRSVLNQLALIPNAAGALISARAYFEFSEALTKQMQQRQLPDMIAEARREADSITVALGVRTKELASVQEIPSPVHTVTAFPDVAILSTVNGTIVEGAILYSVPPASPIRVQYNFDFLLQ